MIQNLRFKNLFIIPILLLASSTTIATEFTGHIGGLIGVKLMDSDDWPELDTHFAMGILFDIKRDSWPISIALDITDTGDKYEHNGMEDLGHTTEYQLGLRKIFKYENRNIQPYIGGGVSVMYAELELEVNNVKMTQDDTDTGAWLGAGMYYEINPKFVLGLDLRYSHGKVTLFDIERNAGGIQTAVSAAYQF